jgi:hypothetical protein
MAQGEVKNFHIMYPGVTNQHWDPQSGRYAGGDHLLTALADGWQIEKCVQVTYNYAVGRGVAVYEFHLTRAETHMTMPVINNPSVERFLLTNDIAIQVKTQPKDAEDPQNLMTA